MMVLVVNGILPAANDSFWSGALAPGGFETAEPSTPSFGCRFRIQRGYK